jgi:hypothetical protein
MLIEPEWLNLLLGRAENKGYVIQTDEVCFGNRILGHLGILFH